MDPNLNRRPLSVPSISYDDFDEQQARQQQQQENHLSSTTRFLDTPFPGGATAGIGPSPSAGAPPGWPPQPPLGVGHGQGQLVKPSSTGSRSRSASTSSLSTPTGGPGPAPKKKNIVTACQRCRTRKIRCDGTLPACKSCVKAGVQCIEVDRTGDNNMPRSHVLELENRIKWLEGIINDRLSDVDLAQGPPVELRSRRPSPPAIRIVTTGPDIDQYQRAQSMSSNSSPIFALSPASTCATPTSFEFSSPGVSPGYLQPMSPFTFSDSPSPTPSPAPSSPFLHAHGRDNTMAHEIGLLSLSLSEEPKYVGPSSGINFARMVFEDTKDIPGKHEQEFDDIQTPRALVPSADAAPLPVEEQCIQFASVYFETVHVQYPFLHKATFDACLKALYRGTSSLLPAEYSMSVAHFHVFLVLSIGSMILSAQTGQAFDSEGYFSSAMKKINEVRLIATVQAVQCALLLAVRALHTPMGLNLWYLNAIIMATCVDLGLQRRLPFVPGTGEGNKAALKRRVFWCAYALDRSIAIHLGRPFTIADDSFDVNLPEDFDNDDELHLLAGQPSVTSSSKINFATSIFLFKMLQLTSTIKSTFYNTPPSAERWQGDLSVRQMTLHRQLVELREQAMATLGTVRRGSMPAGTHTLNSYLVDLRFHEAVQLLFRPSFQRPTSAGLQQAYTSALATIQIYENRRIGEPPFNRHSAQSILLSGITLLHSYRQSPEIQASPAGKKFTDAVRSCSLLLANLAQRWHSARNSSQKFDSLAQKILAEAVTSSSRMLSPNDGARRASSSSHTSHARYAEAATLDVPHMSLSSSAPQQQQHQMPIQGWYGDFGNVDMAWMDPEVQNWDVGMDDSLIGHMEGIEEPMEMLAGMQDTEMWGMDQLNPDQR